MSRSLFVIFCMIGGLIFGPSVSWAEEDIRYLSAEELQHKSQQDQSRRQATARKAAAQKRARAAKQKAARNKTGQKTTTQSKLSAAQRRARAAKAASARKTSQSQANRTSASVPPPPKTVAVRDTLERLNEAIPKKRKEIIKALDVVDHVRTYYTINRGANLKDLQKDSRFKEIYDDMGSDTKMMTYLYLKGLYENSPQAITDKSERNARSLAELPLNRDYTPSKTDIDGFNEKTSFKSKLVRSLSGKYVRTPKPQETIVVPVGTSEDADSID